MELKDRLIKIIKDTYEISVENYYDAWTGDIEYTATKLNIEELADAIIESGLLKDEKVYEVIEQEITIPQATCPNCGYFVGPSFDIISCSYCPGCGVKLKRNRRNHNA